MRCKREERWSPKNIRKSPTMVMFNDADVSLTIVDHNIQRLTRSKEKIHDDRAHPPPWIELLSAHYVNVSCVAINLAARAASLHVPGESRLAEPAHSWRAGRFNHCGRLLFVHGKNRNSWHEESFVWPLHPHESSINLSHFSLCVPQKPVCRFDNKTTTCWKLLLA